MESIVAAAKKKKDGRKNPVPLNLRKVITARGAKLWREDIAELIDEPLLVHYALANNALGDYVFVKDRLAKEEKEGMDTYMTSNNNGTMGVHPLRQWMERCRKTFSDETKRCGLTTDVVEALTENEDEDPFAE